MAELYHIAERTTWLQAAEAGEYLMSTRDLTLAQEGFIHCSLLHQLRGVADRFYRDADDLVVLVIDSAAVPAPVRYESPAPGAEKYPHIYGPLPAQAVTSVIPVGRDPEGNFILPG